MHSAGTVWLSAAAAPLAPTLISLMNWLPSGRETSTMRLSSFLLGLTVISPPPNEAAPRSDDPAKPAATNDANGASDPNELKPAAPGSGTDQQTDDPNELKPNVAAADQPPAAPPQINDIPSGSQGGGSGPQASSADASGQQLADDQMIASSKKKKKKGLHKIIPTK